MKSTIALLLVMCSGVHAQTTGCGVQTGPLMPDLAIDQATLQKSISTGSRKMSSCDVSEGYVPALGKYNIVSFTTATMNVGQADLFLGQPWDCPDIFEPSACYNGWHSKHETAFGLWTNAGWAKAQAALDEKYWFCLIDERAGPNVNGSQGKFTSCHFQGLSVGWIDTYPDYLPGQYIVLDGVPAGSYTLSVWIDPDMVFPDANRLNNVTYATFKWKGN